METRNELNLVKMGAVAALLTALTTVLFFALFNAVSAADPRSETAQFLGDASKNQGLAGVVAWLNAWLGILTVPLYLGLYYAFRRFSQGYMLLATITGIAWGIILIVITPVIFTTLVYIAPGWAGSSDSATRSELANIGAAFGWIINTTIGGTVFLLRALSVLAASRVMLLFGGRLWTGLAWLGIIFAVEHVLAGVTRVFVVGIGGAAGSTLLGAIGGVMLFVWLVGVGIGLWRMREEYETQDVVGSQRLSQSAPVS